MEELKQIVQRIFGIEYSGFFIFLYWLSKETELLPKKYQHLAPECYINKLQDDFSDNLIIELWKSYNPSLIIYWKEEIKDDIEWLLIIKYVTHYYKS